MKLVIITQKVDMEDSVLGFFHFWIEKFSARLDKVFVVCLEEGKHSLLENVEVFSLGKEKGYSKIRQFFRLQKFLWKNLKNVDGVFCHMCPIYAIASWPLAKLFRRKIILWFLHRNVSWELRLANKMVDKILTASPESCQLKNRKKIEVLHHGIDVARFQNKNFGIRNDNKMNILYAGRISEIKNLETLIQAVEILVKDKEVPDIKLNIVGEGIDKKEKAYEEKIKKMVQDCELTDYVAFNGGVPYAEMPKVYQKNDILVSACPTGGIDKVVLEAMASGLPVLTSNKAFREELGKYVGLLSFRFNDADSLAGKILGLKNRQRNEIGNYLKQQVIEKHSLDNLIDKIIKNYEKV